MNYNLNINTINTITIIQNSFARDAAASKDIADMARFIRRLQSSPTTLTMDMIKKLQDTRYSHTAYPVIATEARGDNFDIGYVAISSLPIHEALALDPRRIAIRDKHKIHSTGDFANTHLPSHVRSQTHHRALIDGQVLQVQHDFTATPQHIDLFVKRAILKQVATEVFHEIQLLHQDKKTVKEGIERSREPEARAKQTEHRARPMAEERAPTQGVRHAAHKETDESAAIEAASAKKKQKRREEQRLEKERVADQKDLDKRRIASEEIAKKKK